MSKSVKILKAKKLAKKLHGKQIRVCGESYYDHVKAVADLLVSSGVEDDSIIVAAYLHHIYDAESIPKRDFLLNEFGKDATNIIETYKKLSESEMSNIYPKSIDESLIMQAYLNLAKDPKTLIVRLADKVNNIKTAYTFPKEKAQKIAEYALYLYAPICHLLGIHNFVTPLENEAFKIIHPNIYHTISEYLETNLPKMKNQLIEVTQFIDEILSERNIDYKSSWRVKHIYSIYRKSIKYNQNPRLTKKGLSKIYDMAAMRILVNNIRDCYEVEDILNQALDSIPEQRDDYIQTPKAGGYQSIHGTYKVSSGINLEVQIKTYEMHENNEFGLASHTFYKIGDELKKDLKENPDFLKQMDFLKYKSKIKIDQFTNTIYVFTPKGDIIKLPKNSTGIDFAYAIHRDLGNSCVGAIINGDFKSPTHVLKNGDRVEIKTLRKKTKPSKDWLKMVKTKKARDYIKRSLKKPISES